MRYLYAFILLISSPAFAQLNADFSSSVTQGCTDLVVQFTDKSTGSPTSWFWDFGNGQTSSQRNPLFTYKGGGKFTVRLTIKSSSGQDYEEKENYITVLTSPKADFSVIGPDSGCIALKTAFADASDPLGTTIKSWLWDFKDGTTSSLQNPAHVFNNEGIFDVSLTIQNTLGCSSTQIIDLPIIAGKKPVINFTASPLDGCALTVRDFTNLTPGNITAIFWEFGDNTYDVNVNSEHHYSDTGSFSIKLKISNNGCIDSVEKINYLHVDGPAAKFNKKIDCSDRFTYTYRDISDEEITRKWDFGDGFTSTAKAVTHTYATPGIYTVKLSVTGAVCNDEITDDLHIKTGNPVVSLAPLKNIYCHNDSLQFFVSGYDSVATKMFSWNFRDGYETGYNKNLDSFIYVYKKNNFYKPEVYLKNADNCIDTVSLGAPIEISGPAADFLYANSGCTNQQIGFEDQSTPEKNKPIKNWLWSFGDGGMAYTKGPQTYAYVFPGTYNANLTVTDVDGCIDTITHRLTIATSPVVDAGFDTLICAGSTVLLRASGATDYRWSVNGDLSCVNCNNPAANPQQTTIYYVTGSSNGCSAQDSIRITVQTKEKISVESDMYAICSGGNSVMLIANGTDSYVWSPSNTLSSAIIANPVAFPASNTIYTVIGKDMKSCFSDTAKVNVVVNEKPNVSILDSVAQVIIGSTFTIPGSVSNDVVSYEWLPVTGLSCTDCLRPDITIMGNSSYTLTGVNQFGCVDSASISIVATCTGEALFMPNTFSPNNDGMNDYFYPRSASNINIKSLSIFNRWGQLIFRNQNFAANSANSGWNGKYKNKLQASDVYIYMLELKCGADPKVYIKKGNVSLLR